MDARTAAGCSLRAPPAASNSKFCMKQGMHLLLVGAVAVLGAEDARAPVISLDFGSKPIKYARVVCGKAGKCPSEEDGFAGR